MAKKQTLTCPDCDSVFEFDPNSSTKVITSLNESYIPRLDKDVEVVAYLKCPKGHTNPYKVIKSY